MKQTCHWPIIVTYEYTSTQDANSIGLLFDKKNPHAIRIHELFGQGDLDCKVILLPALISQGRLTVSTTGGRVSSA